MKTTSNPMQNDKEKTANTHILLGNKINGFDVAPHDGMFQSCQEICGLNYANHILVILFLIKKSEKNHPFRNTVSPICLPVNPTKRFHTTFHNGSRRYGTHSKRVRSYGSNVTLHTIRCALHDMHTLYVIRHASYFSGCLRHMSRNTRMSRHILRHM